MGSSLRRTDLLSLSNLRNDGRKPEEIRRMRIQMGPLQQQQHSHNCGGGGGSALVEMGLTVVMATVRGPMECIRRSDELPDRAMLDVSVRMTPFGQADRRTSNPSTDRRLVEAAHLLKCALEAAILWHLYPRSRIEVNVVVLADDGGRLCAAINAATLALVDAGIPMKDLVCACSAGYSNAGGGASQPTSGNNSNGSSSTGDVALVDLNRREESSNAGQPAVYLPCAMLPQRGTIVLAQCEARIPNWNVMEQVLEAAMDGCRAVFEIMQAAIRERAASLLAARNGQALILSSFTTATTT